MRALPNTDARYWATILVACSMGETAGDFVSHELHLGYGLGSIVLIALFSMVMVMELRAAMPNEARYWTAVIITSTTGTTLADFVTRSLKLGYGWGTAALVAVLGLVFLVWRKRSPAPAASTSESVLPHVEIGAPAPGSVLPHAEVGAQAKGGPTTDARYWAAILVISTIGTTLGDFVSDGLGVGAGRGALLLGALLAIVLIVEARAKVASEPRYWTAIVLTSTIGATSGDYLTKDDGLDLGFAVGSAILAALFVVVLLVGRFLARRPAAPAAQA
jgi:uncharacterized membrane-anchored protein